MQRGLENGWSYSLRTKELSSPINTNRGMCKGGARIVNNNSVSYKNICKYTYDIFPCSKLKRKSMRNEENDDRVPNDLADPFTHTLLLHSSNQRQEKQKHVSDQTYSYTVSNSNSQMNKIKKLSIMTTFNTIVCLLLPFRLTLHEQTPLKKKF